MPEALAWIPGEEAFSYIQRDEEKGQTIMKGFVDGRPHEALMSLVELNKLFKSTGFAGPEEIPSFEWLDNERVLISFKGQYWKVNLVRRSQVEKAISCMDIAVNRDLAPDKDHVAFTYKNDIYYSSKTSDSLFITQNIDKNITSGQAVSRFEFGISKGIFWSPYSDRIAYYTKDETAVSDYEVMDYDPIPAAPSPFKYPMAGGPSEKVSIEIFSIKNKDKVTLQTEGPKDQYLTSVTWAADGKSLYVGHLDRSQDDFQLRQYDAKTGKAIRVLFSEHNDKYVEPEHDVFPLEGTEGEFLWFSERDGYEHIYHYAADGKLINQVTSGERVMLEILRYDKESGTLWVMGTDSPLETVLYKVNVLGGEMTRVTKSLGKHKVIMHQTEDMFIDFHSSLSIPMDVRIMDGDGRELYQVSSAADPLEGRRVGTTEIIELKAKDGTTLYSRLIKPNDFDPNKSYPVLVYLYNGPHVQLIEDTWLGGASLWMHAMAERGYIIFTVDGRGSSDRGREFEQAVHSRAGILEVEDQMVGVDYLRTLPYVDAERMGIHGWSYGGYMTLNMMLRKPGVFKVAVAGGPVTDWRFYEVMYTERYMETPKTNENGYRETQLAPLADQLEGKLMLIHGSSDDVVVMQHTMVMLNAFINADKQVDLFIYPGHKHNVVGPDRVHLMTKVLDYIDEEIGN
ncbi:MAG: DPP IV N-terminal domain-containing protein [Bacteroidetes bacterium]|nr:DPP IV N-terminal domain-containing protein [Bacteroidota bacterium]